MTSADAFGTLDVLPSEEVKFKGYNTQPVFSHVKSNKLRKVVTNFAGERAGFFMTNTNKYLVIGGFIRSNTDGQQHYISPQRLMDLYKVNPQDCVLAENNESFTLRGLDRSKFIVLRPRFDGNYGLVNGLPK